VEWLEVDGGFDRTERGIVEISLVRVSTRASVRAKRYTVDLRATSHLATSHLST
jgi:hypothetical protein